MKTINCLTSIQITFCCQMSQKTVSISSVWDLGTVHKGFWTYTSYLVHTQLCSLNLVSFSFLDSAGNQNTADLLLLQVLPATSLLIPGSFFSQGKIQLASRGSSRPLVSSLLCWPLCTLQCTHIWTCQERLLWATRLRVWSFFPHYFLSWESVFLLHTWYNRWSEAAAGCGLPCPETAEGRQSR